MSAGAEGCNAVRTLAIDGAGITRSSPASLLGEVADNGNDVIERAKPMCGKEPLAAMGLDDFAGSGSNGRSL